jgi:hypothetical protein
MSNYLSNSGEEEVNREAKVTPVSRFNTGCKSVFIGIPKPVLALSNSQKLLGLQILDGALELVEVGRLYTGRTCSRVQKSRKVEGVKGGAKSLC